jgi:hypothetical protein
MRIEPVADLGTFPSVAQPVRQGSCGIVVLPDAFTLPDPCTLVVRVQPRLLDGSPQGVADLDGLHLVVGPDGAGLVAGDLVAHLGPALKQLESMG